ncbi:MAG: hypothetical protein QM728_14935 [Gordonia sp. (in: high G+C Gram-positive bacteria)]|uniref:hypothetical protein n=1 Tax=Gordonia sp. (in: high G+C Gram-positive bacteria) TaxID=84139 RepID=UPI0039E504D5
MDPFSIAHTFGTGDGETHTWHAPADVDFNGDGRLDSVRLDFDGDGRIDDLMIDSDSDGVADCAALDLDDDGVVESFFRDTGNGVWGVRAQRPEFSSSGPGPPPAPPRPPPTPPPPPADEAPRPGRVGRPIDTNGDGKPDATLVGLPDGGSELRLDTDGDGRWDTALVDVDGDGVVDRIRRREP